MLLKQTERAEAAQDGNKDGDSAADNDGKQDCHYGLAGISLMGARQPDALQHDIPHPAISPPHMGIIYKR